MSSTLQSQSPARTGKDYAYFFYVSEFQPGWGPLPETKNEVAAIAKQLEDDYGFAVEIFPNFTKLQIEHQIENINKRKYGPDDQVLFFFSSHGLFHEETDRAYLVPTNGLHQTPTGKTWLSFDDLRSLITASACEHILVAVDACNSGYFGKGHKGIDEENKEPERKPWEEEPDCNQKIKNSLTKNTRYYFSSGAKNERTEAQSIFAKRWKELLWEGANSGLIRLKDLRYYFSTETASGPRWGPFTNKHKGGDFVFIHKNACRNTIVINNINPKDNSHWKECLEKKSQNIAKEHMQAYPGCPHHFDALEMLTSNANEKDEPNNINKGPIPSRNMVLIERGPFQMGSYYKDVLSDEKPIHQVTIDDFYIGRFEVTFIEYDAFCDAMEKEYPDDRGWGRGNRPVINISWYDAVEYCNWLSEQHGFKPVYTIYKNKIALENLNEYDDFKWLISVDWRADGYRLPTEAEWEYAARGRGGNDKWAGTSNKSQLNSYGNSHNNNDGYKYTAPVYSFSKNASGLYNMSGNVKEWCWDWYSDDYYSKSKAVNPKGSDKGLFRVQRGGSWNDFPDFLHCTNRDFGSPNLKSHNVGFRLSRTCH